MDEARTHFDFALACYREVGDRRAEGFVLGDLGRWWARTGEIANALAHFAEGEGLLRGQGDNNELGKLLCFRAHARLHAGVDPDLASVDLAEAEALALALGAGPDSKLGKLLAETRRPIADAPFAPPASVQDGGSE